MQTVPVTIAAAGRTTSVSSAPLAREWVSLHRTDADGASDEGPS